MRTRLALTAAGSSPADSRVCLQLLPETLYLTCSIIDRFLEKKGVLRKRLQLVRALLCLPGDLCCCNKPDSLQFAMQACTPAQLSVPKPAAHRTQGTQPDSTRCAARLARFLAVAHTCAPVQVGITAMLIASKYEDVWAPEVRDFVYISDHAYTAEQILEMEKIMLNTLRFQLTVPTGAALVLQAGPRRCRLVCLTELCLSKGAHSQSEAALQLNSIFGPPQQLCRCMPASLLSCHTATEQPRACAAYNFMARFCKASSISLAKKSNGVLEDKRALYATYLVELSLVRCCCCCVSVCLAAGGSPAALHACCSSQQDPGARCLLCQSYACLAASHTRLIMWSAARAASLDHCLSGTGSDEADVAQLATWLLNPAAHCA